MATKVEVETKLAQTEADFEQFKKDVVKNAMAAAKRHNWCEVTQRTLIKMGLESYLPNRFVIQQKRSARGGWSNTYETATTARGAVAMATRNRNNFLETEKRRHDRRFAPSSTPDYRYFEYNGRNGDSIIKDLQKIAKEKEEVANGTVPEFVAPKYPQYRAVRMPAMSREVLEVLSVAE